MEMKMVGKLRTWVRPIMTLSFTATVIYLAIEGKIEPREIMLVYGIIMAFYFGERAALKQPHKGGEDK